MEGEVDVTIIPDVGRGGDQAIDARLIVAARAKQVFEKLGIFTRAAIDLRGVGISIFFGFAFQRGTSVEFSLDAVAGHGVPRWEVSGTGQECASTFCSVWWA